MSCLAAVTSAQIHYHNSFARGLNCLKRCFCPFTQPEMRFSGLREVTVETATEYCSLCARASLRVAGGEPHNGSRGPEIYVGYT
jgi:hypothetical protein